MRALRLSVPIVALSVSLLGGRSAGADVISADQAPPHITFADGQVWLEREGESQPAEVGLPFLPGDRLRSTVGRTEILFPDGTALHLDDGSSIELLSPSLLRLTSGRLRLIVAGVGGPEGVRSFQIDTPAASAVIEGPGEYRVTLLDGPSGVETELAVARGWATLATDLGETPMRAGERSVARYGEPPSRPFTFNAAAFDTFDLWSAARRDARIGRAGYATHLPRELQMYGGILEREGNWHQEAGYGYVWYPSVPVDWHPYSHGYWNDLPVYGWTWIGLSVWDWPTHHYGRWAHARSRWFWVPGRTWRPAWVHWAAAPGYVGWSPWGFARHTTFGLSFSVGRPGWVVVPRASFGRRGPTHWARNQQSFPSASRFIVQDRPPVPHVARGIRVSAEPARRVAVPRGSPRAADASIVRFPDARRAPRPGANAAGAAPPQDSVPPAARVPQGGWTSSTPASRARRSAPPPDPEQGTPARAPAAARPPRAGWAPPRAAAGPVESTGRAGRGREAPEAASPAPAAPAQAPAAGAAGWSPRTRAVPRSSAAPAARETPPASRGRATRASGDGSSAAAAQPQAGARRAAPAGGSQTRSRARR